MRMREMRKYRNRRNNIIKALKYPPDITYPPPLVLFIKKISIATKIGTATYEKFDHSLETPSFILYVIKENKNTTGNIKK